VKVIEKIAELKNLNTEEVRERISRNANEFFSDTVFHSID
jgi:Tat protein secretion system quality control protein TatD with DNase activity